jgi:hypothetical protein
MVLNAILFRDPSRVLREEFNQLVADLMIAPSQLLFKVPPFAGQDLEVINLVFRFIGDYRK